MSLLAIWFWLMVGNVAYQVVGPQNWLVALDHSYWQASAISGVWLASKIRSLLTQHHQG